MTGFGKALVEMPQKKVSVEIKSLNSKQMEMSTRIPSYLREKEMEIRSLIAQRLERGKVDFTIYLESTGASSSTIFNQPVIQGYKQQIESLAQTLDIDVPTNWFSVLLKLPETIKTEIAEIDESEWSKIAAGIEKAIAQLQAFRVQEGEMLANFMLKRIGEIERLLKEVDKYEVERIERVKTRIKEALITIGQTDYDKNRFEQELIYYIEKLDVNEEKSRLKNHLTYFIETLEKGSGQGKKLGFIVQEIGREVNTLGSKSNHAELQKIVVLMKDNLEQIKEQVLNIL
jgi:uncharacterized protein (TIGR00255 family)